MKEYLAELAASCWYCVGIKGVASLIIAGEALLFGFKNTETVSAIIILIIFDLITGILAARKNGEPVQSRKAWKTAVKLFAYGMMLSASYLTTRVIPGVDFIFTVMAAFLALTELISILENAGKMGYHTPKKLLGQLDKMVNNK